MKTLLAIWLLLTTAVASSQVFLILEPAFLRPGVLYNYDFDRVGIWGKVWYGNIRGEHPDGGKFYTRNIKGSIGLSTSYDGARWFLGVNYNYFFDTQKDDRIARLDRIQIVSMDIGVSLTRGRFTALMMTDPFNWESCVGVSYQFKQTKCPVYKKKH